MLLVGLTGGIGSGKTTVSDTFHSAYNIPVIDADEISRGVLTPGGDAYTEVIEIFGPESTFESGEINRKFLREKIFSNEELRIKLENIIHPKVRRSIAQQIKELDAKYCLIVIPLLIESNMHSMVDRILVVDTHKQFQLERISLRDQCDINHVQAIIDAQIEPEERLKSAHDIIDNNGQPEDLINQIQQLHEKYLALSI